MGGWQLCIRRHRRLVRNCHRLHHCADREAKMNNDLFSRLYLWLVAHRRPVLLVTLLSAVGCAVYSARMNMEEDILGILSQNDPIVRDYRYTIKTFRQIDRAYMDVGTTNA